MKVAQLRAELSRRDLPIKGNKAELVSRLEESDAIANSLLDVEQMEKANQSQDAAAGDSPMGDADGATAEGFRGDREMTAEDEGDEVHCSHALLTSCSCPFDDSGCLKPTRLDGCQKHNKAPSE
jgi:hypothetical protein